MRSVALVLIVSASAHALPVRVLSRTQVELSVLKRWDSLQVSGTLTDDGGSGVSLAEVTLSLGRAESGNRTLLTDAAGRFSVTLTGDEMDRLAGESQGDPNVRLAVRYGGDSLRGAVTSEQVLDLTRETLQLHVVVSPPRAMLGRPPRILAVLRHEMDPAVGQRLVAEVGGVTLATTTDAEGHAVFRALPPLGAGRHHVVVRFEGSERFNPLQVMRDLTMVVRTQVTLERVDRGAEPFELKVAGSLHAAGKPLAGTVALVLDDTAYGYARAGPDGNFAETLDLTGAAMRFGPRSMPLRAAYAPAETWELPSLSPSIAVDVPPPPHVPLMAYLVPLAVAGLGLALVTLVRSGVLVQLYRALRSGWGRRSQPRRRTPDARGPPVLEVEDDGDEGPALHDHLAGTVWDGHADHVLIGAEVAVSGGGAEKATRSAAGGGFRLGPLPPGRHTLTLRHPGYVAESLTVTLPHTGYLARCRLRLTPVRALSAAAYCRFVREIGPPGAAFGVQTPRELGRLLASCAKGGPEAIDRLTMHFEAHYYGGDPARAAEHHATTLDLLSRARGA